MKKEPKGVLDPDAPTCISESTYAGYSEERKREFEEDMMRLSRSLRDL